MNLDAISPEVKTRALRPGYQFGDDGARRRVLTRRFALGRCSARITRNRSATERVSRSPRDRSSSESGGAANPHGLL